MKITKETICKIPEKEQGLVKALLVDLEEINQSTNKELYLDWIDTHTEYSPERTDPCPDFYGMYRVIRNGDVLGVEMTLDELDISLCLLHNFIIND